MWVSFRVSVVASVMLLALSSQAAEFKILQPLAEKPKEIKKGSYYVPTTPETARWGSLPNADSKPVLTMPSGSLVTFDTVSHEGVLEDQGKDPVKFFGQFGKRCGPLTHGRVLPEGRVFVCCNQSCHELWPSRR